MALGEQQLISCWPCAVDQ